MADYDVLDMAVMLRDAQRSLRKLFPDYETKAEPCRQVLRRMMDDIPTDKVLVALPTHCRPWWIPTAARWVTDSAFRCRACG